MKRKVVFFFVVPSFLLLFLALFSFVFYPFVKYVWGQSDRYCIDTIIQRKPPHDSLKCSFLAEVLGLSLSKKNYLYHFNVPMGEEKLKSTIFIKDAHIKKIKPSTLFIEYSLREPIALIGNYSHVAIDNEGVVFETKLYTPKNLPEIYLEPQLEPIALGKALDDTKMQLIRTLLDNFPPYSIETLDFSKMNVKTLGEREIVIKVKNEHFLRLTPRDLNQEIAKYFLLKKKAWNALKESQTIDLRIPQVAIIGA